jgi:hypothetical protein
MCVIATPLEIVEEYDERFLNAMNRSVTADPPSSYYN